MAHAAPTFRAGAAARSTAAVAPLLAVVYGVWAAGIHRAAGPITTGNVLFGVLTGLIAGALYLAARALAPRLPRELRAFVWGAYAGVAFGYLYSLTGASILRSIGNAALVAGAVACAVFYRYYSTED
ncbi:hypothetical protein ACFQVC_16515 [Streptomyces monticola]|uniref:Integral membrane protein n=1 Tax=Streptomyces monticola TaxID=2666263 RepID=A0ABW2JJ70_9ACTN